MIDADTSTESHATRHENERWINKQQLAEHLLVTPRWIELQQHVGLPHLRAGVLVRYRISEVEAWLRQRYPHDRTTDASQTAPTR
jgi:hypothetical protein